MSIYINNIRYLTTIELVDILNVSRQTLWRWRKAGVIPEGRRYRGRQVVFSEEDFQEIQAYAQRISPIEDAIPSQLDLALDAKREASLI